MTETTDITVPAPDWYRIRRSQGVNEDFISVLHGQTWPMTLRTVETMFFSFGYDTKDISQSLMMPEHLIYRALGEVRERRRAS